MMIILQSQECSYETNYHDISKTIRWHSKLGCHLIIFSCYCFVATVENLKPKNQKKISPNLWIVVRKNARQSVVQ